MFKPFKCGDVVLYSTGLQKKLHKGRFLHYRNANIYRDNSFVVEISIDNEKNMFPVQYCIPFKNNEHLEGEILWDDTLKKVYDEEGFKPGDLVLVRSSILHLWTLGRFYKYSYCTGKCIYEVTIPYYTDVATNTAYKDEKVYKCCIPFIGNEKYFMTTDKYKED